MLRLPKYITTTRLGMGCVASKDSSQDRSKAKRKKKNLRTVKRRNVEKTISQAPEKKVDVECAVSITIVPNVGDDNKEIVAGKQTQSAHDLLGESRKSSGGKAMQHLSALPPLTGPMALKQPTATTTMDALHQNTLQSKAPDFFGELSQSSGGKGMSQLSTLSQLAGGPAAMKQATFAPQSSVGARLPDAFDEFSEASAAGKTGMSNLSTISQMAKRPGMKQAMFRARSPVKHTELSVSSGSDLLSALAEQPQAKPAAPFTMSSAQSTHPAVTGPAKNPLKPATFGNHAKMSPVGSKTSLSAVCR